jgi:hypothetical protein
LLLHSLLDQCIKLTSNPEDILEFQQETDVAQAPIALIRVFQLAVQGDKGLGVFVRETILRRAVAVLFTCPSISPHPAIDPALA